MAPLFFYGTLCHRPLFDCVLGPEAAGVTLRKARLPGYAVHHAVGHSYPMIVPRAGAAAEGVIAEGLSDAALARLDYYEGGHLYDLQEQTVETGGGRCAARVYFPAPKAGLEPGTPWTVADWAAHCGTITTLAAEEVMEGFGRDDPALFMRRYPSILARAASHLRAQSAAPATLRRDVAPGDVTVLDRQRPYAHFFAVEDYKLTHRRFSGGESPVLDRAVFVSNDAVTVLPYDPARDRVMLIEQFRMGPFARGDVQPWSLEAIAGRIDPGEGPEETARREAKEEAGLKLGALEPICNYYPSPGAKSEFIYSFLALTDLPDAAAGLGGAEGEGEDIRAHVIGFKRAMSLIESGEIGNAPLILSLYWLAGRRDGLRAGA